MPDEIFNDKDQKAEEIEKLLTQKQADILKKYDPKLIEAYVQERRTLEELSRKHREEGVAIRGAYRTLKTKYTELGLDLPNVDLGLEATDRIRKMSVPQELVFPLLQYCTSAQGYATEDEDE